MGFGILFVPLVGGYLFLTRCNWTRFLIRRQSGYHLLFASASVALVLLSIARVLAMAVGKPPPGTWVMEYWSRAAPFSYFGTIALAFLLGPVAALLINLFYTESRGAMLAVRQARNSMELLLVECMEQDLAAEIAVSPGKVYVGWILNASVAEPERRYVEILPLATGWRTKETDKLRFTMNYAGELIEARTDETKAKRLRLVFPASEIESAQPFNVQSI